MNGLEKSDSVIVAVKSVNKGAPVPAEPMEPRTEPKGNPEGQSTRRTQDRESVSQAADRIRQFVQREPRERLTALLHHVTADALRWAFFRVEEGRGGRCGWHDVADVRRKDWKAGWPTCTTECTRERTGRRHRGG